MTSPPALASRLKGFFKGFKRSNSRKNFYNEGSSRRGGIYGHVRDFERASRFLLHGSHTVLAFSVQEDVSYGKDSSTRSIMFDLELSQKGIRRSARDFEDLESPTHEVKGSSVAQRLESLATPVATFEIELLQDVQSLSASLRETFAGSVPVAHLASDLAAMGYSCTIQCVEKHMMNDTQSNYEPDNTNTKCLELLRHEFIICDGKLDGSVEHQCVIDPQFRDQFLLGKHNVEYEDLLRFVPPEFVGSALRLQAIVSVICAQMTKVYQELGISLPPWRRPRAVLGKWFDTDVGNTNTAPQESHNDTNHRNDESKTSNIFSRVKSSLSSDKRGKQSASAIAFEKSNKPHRQSSRAVSTSTMDNRTNNDMAEPSSARTGQVSLLAQRLQRLSTHD